MKILMIGGTGTISYDATIYFLKCGHEVYLLNRGNRNTIHHENLHYIIGDINDDTSIQTLDGKSFDVIMDFIIFNRVQLERRMEMYEGKCRQFFFISSATVYKIQNGIYTENTPLGNDEWAYSRSKRECEEFLKNNISKYSYEYTIIRPYITYDNRRLPFPVVTKKSYYSLLYRIMCDKPVIICGDGNNKLTLTHTKDFAVALEGLILNPMAMNEAFHITGDSVTTWNEILSVISKELGKKCETINIPIAKLAEYFPSEQDELLYDKSCDHVFDNRKIKSAVPRFKTTYSVDEGITDTVRNLLSNVQLQKADKIWDCTVDAIIERYESENNDVKHKASLKARVVYWVFQKSNNRYMKKIFKIIMRQ